MDKMERRIDGWKDGWISKGMELFSHNLCQSEDQIRNTLIAMGTSHREKQKIQKDKESFNTIKG